jgi:colanic acid biosynthesis glycosyl transferase WcaI
MRILVYGLNFAPELTGIGKYTGEMVFWMAEHGDDVHVVSAPPYYPQWRIQAGYSGRRYRRESLRGMEIFRCPLWVTERPSNLQRFLHLLSFSISSLPVLLKQAVWRPDIILCVIPTLFTALPALLVARLCGAKAWLHVQDFELETSLNLDMLSGFRFLYSWAAVLEKFLLTHFDRVSSISESMLNHSIEKGVQTERAVLFPNWVDTRKIRPLEEENPLRVALGLDPRQLIVLYHGSMGNKQGLEILISAAPMLQDMPNLLFILCGRGPARAELEEQAKTLANIRFLDLQPLEKLNLLVNLADIHILPQRAGAADLVMPSKLTSMLASGKAVIATADKDTELGQVVDQVGLRVPPGNPTALAEAIRYLAYNPDERSRLGALGREFVLQNWEREDVLNRINSQLHELVGLPQVN